MRYQVTGFWAFRDPANDVVGNIIGSRYKMMCCAKSCPTMCPCASNSINPTQNTSATRQMFSSAHFQHDAQWGMFKSCMNCMVCMGVTGLVCIPLYAVAGALASYLVKPEKQLAIVDLVIVLAVSLLVPEILWCLIANVVACAPTVKYSKPGYVRTLDYSASDTTKSAVFWAEAEIRHH
jgi:hypothetical protein